MMNIFGILEASESDRDIARRVIRQSGAAMPPELMTLEERTVQDFKRISEEFEKQYFEKHGTLVGFQFRGIVNK